MAIRRKPQNVNEFIKAGGAEAAGKQPTPAGGKTSNVIQPVVLRLEPELLQEVDKAVKARRTSPSRHQWILEAIYEKLSRCGS